MLRVRERVAVREVELLVGHVVQEHVDAREVVGVEVDLLAEVAADLALAEDLLELQEERAGADRGVIDL